MSTVIEVTADTFATEVLAADTPVLVDYWADWCMPCKQLAPVIDELAATYEGRIKFVKIDTSEHINLAASQGIQSLPTLQLYIDGQVATQMIGAKPKSAIVRALDEHV